MNVEFNTNTQSGCLIIGFTPDKDFDIESVECIVERNLQNYSKPENPVFEKEYRFRFRLKLSENGLMVLKDILNKYNEADEYTTWKYIKTRSGEYLVEIYLTDSFGYFSFEKQLNKVFISISKRDAEYLKKVLSHNPKEEK